MNKLHENYEDLEIEIMDVDADRLEVNRWNEGEIEGKIYGYVSYGEDEHDALYFEARFDASPFDIEWDEEEDDWGKSYYYAESAQIDGVGVYSIDKWTIDNYPRKDEEVSDERACEILGIDESGLKKIYDRLEELAVDAVQEYVDENLDNLRYQEPEPEDYYPED